MCSCGEWGLLSELQCMGFSLQWFLLLLTAGSRAHGLSSCGSRALEHRLSRGFPGGSVVKNPPADAGDRSLIPALGRTHVLWSSKICPLCLFLFFFSPCFLMRNPSIYNMLPEYLNDSYTFIDSSTFKAVLLGKCLCFRA